MGWLSRLFGVKPRENTKENKTQRAVEQVDQNKLVKQYKLALQILQGESGVMVSLKNLGITEKEKESLMKSLQTAIMLPDQARLRPKQQKIVDIIAPIN